MPHPGLSAWASVARCSCFWKSLGPFFRQWKASQNEKVSPIGNEITWAVTADKKESIQLLTDTEPPASVIVQEEVLHRITCGICKRHLLHFIHFMALDPNLHGAFLPIKSQNQSDPFSISPTGQGFTGPRLGPQDLPAVGIPHEAHQHRGLLGALVVPQALGQGQHGAGPVRAEGRGLTAIGHQPGATAVEGVDQATGGVVGQGIFVGKAETPMAQGNRARTTWDFLGMTC